MYIGIDYHKRYSVTTMMDETGTIMKQQRVSNDPQSLLAFAASLPNDSTIALEATNGWYYFYELLEEHCSHSVLAHPLKTRAIAEARIKTAHTRKTVHQGIDRPSPWGHGLPLWVEPLRSE